MNAQESAAPLVAVVGPTASGKSALAVLLAGKLGGEVIACDSTQLYRRFNIGTAKPDETERRGVPHHLLDVYEPEQISTAGEYRRLALEVLEDLRRSLQALKPREVDAYFHTPDILVTSQAVSIIEAARVKKLPTMFHEVSLVSKGALASYGHNYHQIGRMSAKYVQRILAGTPSRDLPVESYDKIELALNLRTAREIGLTIPSSVGVRADRLIE